MNEKPSKREGRRAKEKWRNNNKRTTRSNVPTKAKSVTTFPGFILQTFSYSSPHTHTHTHTHTLTHSHTQRTGFSHLHFFGFSNGPIRIKASVPLRFHRRRCRRRRRRRHRHRSDGYNSPPVELLDSLTLLPIPCRNVLRVID